MALWADAVERLSGPLTTEVRAPETAPLVVKRQVRLWSAQVDDLVSRYLAGEAVVDIAADLDVARQTVHEHLRRRETPHRRRPGILSAGEIERGGSSLESCRAEARTQPLTHGAGSLSGLDAVPQPRPARRRKTELRPVRHRHAPL